MIFRTFLKQILRRVFTIPTDTFIHLCPVLQLPVNRLPGRLPSALLHRSPLRQEAPSRHRPPADQRSLVPRPRDPGLRVLPTAVPPVMPGPVMPDPVPRMADVKNHAKITIPF